MAEVSQKSHKMNCNNKGFHNRISEKEIISMLGFYTELYTEVHWRRIRPEASERLFFGGGKKKTLKVAIQGNVFS